MSREDISTKYLYYVELFQLVVIDTRETREKFKINALLKEYGELRANIRTYTGLAVTFLALSLITFIVMFMAAIITHEPILLFVSPGLSIVFILTGLSMTAYITNLGLMASEIEEEMNEMLGESVMRWEMSVGVFTGYATDLLVKRLDKIWYEMSFLAVGIAMTLVIISLWYTFGEFYTKIGLGALGFLIFDITISVATVFLAYKLFRGSWEKVKKSKTLNK
jgi:hypothetical protein